MPHEISHLIQLRGTARQLTPIADALKARLADVDKKEAAHAAELLAAQQELEHQKELYDELRKGQGRGGAAPSTPATPSRCSSRRPTARACSWSASRT